MSAKHQAAAAVRLGMSVRSASKKFGVPRSTLRGHLAITNRMEECTEEQSTRLVMRAADSVISGRLSARKAANIYGVPGTTLRRRVKNPALQRGRPTLLTKSEKETLKDILIRLGKLNCGLTRRALQILLKEIGMRKGSSLCNILNYFCTSFLLHCIKVNNNK